MLRTDVYPVGDRTAEDLCHGIGILGGVEIQPGALGVLFQQAQPFQAASGDRVYFPSLSVANFAGPTCLPYPLDDHRPKH